MIYLLHHNYFRSVVTSSKINQVWRIQFKRNKILNLIMGMLISHWILTIHPTMISSISKYKNLIIFIQNRFLIHIKSISLKIQWNLRLLMLTVGWWNQLKFLTRFVMMSPNNKWQAITERRKIKGWSIQRTSGKPMSFSRHLRINPQRKNSW